MKKVVILLVLAIAGGCTTDTPTIATPTTRNNTSDSTAPPSGSSPRASDETIVIDVRSRSEWDAGHVSQAIHIPHSEIAERILEATTDRNAKIVVYCAVGGRAAKAKKALEDLGFTNVENGGGYDDVKDRF